MKFFPSTLSQILLAIFILLGTAGCNNPSPPGEEFPLVSTIVVEPRDLPAVFDFIAQTQSSHLVNIQARVNGFLEKQVYKEGARVKKDEVLFIMDKKPFEAQLAGAEAALARQEAALETARSNLARVEPLSKLNALSQKDLDDAIGAFQTNSASVAQAKAQLETAQLNLSYCTITSPLDGITSAALKQEGSYLSVSDSMLTTVSALTPIWVNFSVSQYMLQNIRDQFAKGLLTRPKNDEYDVKIILINGSLFPHSGKITFTQPEYNSQTGTFLMRVTVDNPEGLLRPNQYVHAQVHGARRPHAIAVPQRAVQQSSKGPFVWVINDALEASMRPVTLGDWYENEWLINQGLNPGDEVVVDGTQKLHEGKKVKREKLNLQPSKLPSDTTM